MESVATRIPLDWVLGIVGRALEHGRLPNESDEVSMGNDSVLQSDWMTLGASERNAWRVASNGTVDLVRPPLQQLPCRIAATPHNLILDLNRTALVVVDMQKDFCAAGGWFHGKGVDLRPVRDPIVAQTRLIPELRRSGVAIVWLNWGNRADIANLPPNVVHAGNPDGRQRGYGDDRPGGGGPILVRGSPGSALVDELRPEAADFLVHKYRFSGFPDTELDSLLRNRQITTVLFAGVNLDVCVFATLIDASFHGYDCIVVRDACGTASPQNCSEAVYHLVHTLYGFSTTTDDLLNGLTEASHQEHSREEARQ
jgi:nicotinamidase-related amidase